VEAKRATGMMVLIDGDIEKVLKDWTNDWIVLSEYLNENADK